MNQLAILLASLKADKTVASATLAVVSGLGMVITRTLDWGRPEVFQALTVVFSGAAAIGLKIAVAELSALAQVIQGQIAAAGTSPAAGTGTNPPVKAS